MSIDKNYTGPTIANMAPQFLDPTVPTAQIPMRQGFMTPGKILRLTTPGIMPPYPFCPPNIEIPPPPLGKLIFSTFPAAYKKKASRTGWQIYPSGRNR